MVRIEWPLHIVRRVVLGTVAAAVLAVGGWFAVSWLEESRARCGDGVVKRGEDKECVGVTDGSYVFRGHLTQVEKAIEKENDRIEKEKEPYVSVAYMTSFTLDGTDSNSDESVRHELQGAYLAQVRHNRGDLAASPKIRLLIANTGGGSDHWRYTVGELIKRKNADERLVAVTGLGPSTDENRAAVDLLSKQGIAMVASTMTATSIKDIHNFVRVSPTNVDEAYAAAAYLKRQKFRTAVVVQDAAKGNLYATTLGSEFTRAFPDAGHRLVAETMTYDSSVVNAWESEMNFMSSQLCDEEPQVIYFAGRGTQLMRFLNALSNRACQKVEFTVIAGDDTTNLTAEQLAAAAKKRVEVLYTGLAHPDMYRTNPEAVSAPSAAYFAEGGFLDKEFPNNSREDGQAIMAHDAVLTAARGIQMAAREGKVTVTGDAVARMFHQMNGGQQVPGASGFLSFQNNGNPRDKAVPVLRLTAQGRAEFVEASAARGKPQENQ
jgi:ABC-type branched-subunit amino acid transport system substrate-binding protein